MRAFLFFVIAMLLASCLSGDGGGTEDSSSSAELEETAGELPLEFPDEPAFEICSLWSRPKEGTCGYRCPGGSFGTCWKQANSGKYLCSECGVGEGCEDWTTKGSSCPYTP